jgi:hypothetical protein
MVLTAKYLAAGCQNILLDLLFETLRRKRRNNLEKIKGFKGYPIRLCDWVKVKLKRPSLNPTKVKLYLSVTN